MANKPFNLAAALAGVPVVTRNGAKVIELHHFPLSKRVGYMLTGYTTIISILETGKAYNHCETSTDLFMAPKKRTVYVNFYENGDAFHFDSPYIASDSASSKALAVAVSVEIEY